MSSEFSTPRAEEYSDLLKDRLPDKTIRHVESVARFLLTFADEAGITDEQAVTAGLLHDICKAFPKERLTAEAESYGITEDLDNPNLLHGPVGAEVCRHELGIEDEEVLDAIRYHTTGKGEWGKVGCALYLADFAEPLRTIPEADRARKILATKGYRKALRFVAGQKERYVRRKFTPNENSLAFFDWIANTD